MANKYDLLEQYERQNYNYRIRQSELKSLQGLIPSNLDRQGILELIGKFIEMYERRLKENRKKIKQYERI